MFSLRLKILAKKLFFENRNKIGLFFYKQIFMLKTLEKNGFDVCLLPTNWKRSESLNGRRSSLKGALSH
jgi:hypothetical protein